MPPDYLREAMRFRCLVLLIFLSGTGWKSLAQAVPDTMAVAPVPDTLAQRKRAESVAAAPAPLPASDSLVRRGFSPVPKKSGLYSSLIPGAGQLYNRQYWKVPIIYVGMAISGYYLIDNSRNYTRFRTAYIQRTDGDVTTRDDYENLYTPGDLSTRRDTYKRFLDITVLLTTIGYAVQILDAVTYAHLHDFDVSPKISLRAQPVLGPGYAGLGLVMRW